MPETDHELRPVLDEVRGYLERLAHGQQDLTNRLERLEARVTTIEQDQKQFLRDLIELRADARGALEAAKGAAEGARRSATAAESAAGSIKWAIGLAASTLATVLIGGLLIDQTLGRLEARVEILAERVATAPVEGAPGTAPVRPQGMLR